MPQLPPCSPIHSQGLNHRVFRWPTSVSGETRPVGSIAGSEACVARSLATTAALAAEASLRTPLRKAFPRVEHHSCSSRGLARRSELRCRPDHGGGTCSDRSTCRTPEAGMPAGSTRSTHHTSPLPARVATRPHSFRRMTSCSISLSKERSATSFLSLPCSSSSRFISVGSSPSYFFFQLKYVAWLIPARRQISATEIPSDPCFRMNAFCASENFDAFIRLPFLPAKGCYRGKLRFRTIQFSGIRAIRAFNRHGSCCWALCGCRCNHMAETACLPKKSRLSSRQERVVRRASAVKSWLDFPLPPKAIANAIPCAMVLLARRGQC